MIGRPPRHAVPAEQTWDLEGLYPDATSWEADLARVDELLAALGRFRGTLDEGPEALLACHEAYATVAQLAERVLWFASNRLAEDQADPERQGIYERAAAMSARFNAATAFLQPELIGLPEGTVESYLEREPRLEVYRLFLSDILDERHHTLGGEAEEVLAGMTELIQAPYDIWKNIANADVAFEPVADEDGRLVPMSLSALTRLLQSRKREVRQAAYESAQAGFEAHKRALAATFAAAQKRDVILARLRRYPSSLAAALAPVHLPEELFHNLLRVSEAGAVHLRRYHEFRRRELGLERLLPYDLNAPLDDDISLAIGFPEACDLVLRALAPLGPDYGAVLERAFRERWIDWADNAGKRSGAYSSSCYGYHPIVLLNWQGKVSDTFILAHELGHAVHSTFSERAQPYIYARYPLFLAEVASTTNELLLARFLLDGMGDRPLRRYVLTRALGSFTSNFFGGSTSAALQLAVHRQVEEGRPLTYESITELNTAILRRWHADSVEITPEGMGCQWTRALHHFRNFYSYQYATGIAAAAVFADAILREGEPAVRRYLRFLHAGSSAHAIDILREAGVDMEDPAPLERAVSFFAALLDELEALDGQAPRSSGIQGQ